MNYIINRLQGALGHLFYFPQPAIDLLDFTAKAEVNWIRNKWRDSKKIGINIICNAFKSSVLFVWRIMWYLG